MGAAMLTPRVLLPASMETMRLAAEGEDQGEALGARTELGLHDHGAVSRSRRRGEGSALPGERRGG